MIVVKYIGNKSRRFVTIVANRVATVLQESEPRQWRHARSEHNRADYASHGIETSETKKLEKWRNVLGFLWKNENEWPLQPTEASEALLQSYEGV